MTPDVVGIKQPKTFHLPSVIGYSQGNFTVPRVQFVVVVGFFKLHLFCHFDLKNTTCSTPPSCLLCNHYTVSSFSRE